MTELRKRLDALQNGPQSQSRKANTKPTPQKNPKPKSICDQYRDLVDQIDQELERAVRYGSKAEVAELESLANRAARDAQKHGCRGIYLRPTKPGGLVIDKFKAQK